MEIKLIALDLDGTTLGRGAVLSQKTKETLEEAIAAGVHVVVATGRTLGSVPAPVLAIRGLEYIITSNGAQLTRLADRKTIYSNCPDREAIGEIGAILASYPQYPIEVFTGGRAYIDKAVFEDVRDNGSDFMDAAYVIATRTPVAGIYDFLSAQAGEIENINIHFPDMQAKAAMREILSAVKSVTVTTSTHHNLEIGGRTTSKADAIRHLCGILGIGEENVMAAGDSPNDGAMIEAAGLGVAVANALDEVKAKADFITLANDEDGVAYAVDKFVLARKQGRRAAER